MTTALKKKAGKLAAGMTLKERVEFAEILMTGVNDFVSTNVERAWDREIKQRLDEYRAGRVKAVPAKQIHAELGRKLNEIKARRISSRRAA
ncbi:MAG TPA: addiction module protein [Verrucomicrobiae bacterium]|jgi:putative addiction module component (TIGR02574 family)|nr:addiction module protein [Verrucomicrobiae bacterium]